jgi:hypothetical protein
MLLSAPPGNSAIEAEPEVEEVEVSIGAGELATLIDRYSLLCFRDRPLSRERLLLHRASTGLKRLELRRVVPPPEVGCTTPFGITEPVDLELGVCYSWSKGFGPCKECDSDQTCGSCWGAPPRPHLCHICWGEHRSKYCDDTEAIAKFKKRKTRSSANMGKDGKPKGGEKEETPEDWVESWDDDDDDGSEQVELARIAKEASTAAIAHYLGEKKKANAGRDSSWDASGGDPWDKKKDDPLGGYSGGPGWTGFAKKKVTLGLPGATCFANDPAWTN